MIQLFWELLGYKGIYSVLQGLARLKWALQLREIISRPERNRVLVQVLCFFTFYIVSRNIIVVF